MYTVRMRFGTLAGRRLLFVSLSGVRIVDDELRAIGLSLPGFIERGKTIAALPSLGLLTLAAHTPEHWQIGYREFDALCPGDAEQLADEGWTLIAISALSARILEAYRFADELRALGMSVVLGGLHVSALPDEAEPHADAVVVGQGEPAWPDLLRDFEAGAPRRRYEVPRSARVLKRKQRPVPRYDLLQPERYNRIPLMTMRGCPLDCSFCAASRTISDYQIADLDDVARDLTTIGELWHKPFLELADDNTFASRRRGRELARLLGQSGARWFTETDISVADDLELLDTLASSGCAQLLIGLESARRSSLMGVDSRGFKWARADRYAESIGRIQSRGISVNGCFVLGFDDDDESVFVDTFELVQRLQLAEVQITLLTPFPGTRLYAELKHQNRLLPSADWSQCTLFDVTFEPARMSVDTLKTGFRNLMRALYAEDEVARRKRVYRQCQKQKRTHQPV